MNWKQFPSQSISAATRHHCMAQFYSIAVKVAGLETPLKATLRVPIEVVQKKAINKLEHARARASLNNYYTASFFLKV